MTSNTNRKVGIIINWTNIFAQVIISLLFIPFFLKTVGDRQYGLYSFSSSFIAWIDTLMVAVASAYHKYLTREKVKNGEYGEARACGTFLKAFIFISLLILVFGLIFDLLLFLELIPLYEYNVNEKNQICLIILMSVLSTSLSGLMLTRSSYNFYKQKFIILYSVAFAQTVLQSVLSIVALKIGYDVVVVALIHFSVALISTFSLSLVSKFFLKQNISFKPNSSEDRIYRKKLMIEIIVFSSFVLLNTIVDTINKTLDKTILGFYNSNSVSIYQLAYSIPAYMISFTSVISILFNQQVNAVFFSENGISKMNALFLKVSKYQTIFTLLLVGGFITCGKEFVNLWLGDGYYNVYVFASIFMIIYSLTCSNRLAAIARRAQNCHIKASIIFLGVAVFNVVISLLFISLFSKEKAIWACVFGTILTEVIGHWIIMQIYDAKVTHLDTRRFFINFVKLAIIAGTIGLVVGKFYELLNLTSTFLSFVLKGTTYLLLYCVVVLFVEKDISKIIHSSIFKLKNIIKTRKSNNEN